VFDNLGGVCLWICGERKVFDNLGEEREGVRQPWWGVFVGACMYVRREEGV